MVPSNSSHFSHVTDSVIKSSLAYCSVLENILLKVFYGKILDCVKIMKLADIRMFLPEKESGASEKSETCSFSPFLPPSLPGFHYIRILACRMTGRLVSANIPRVLQAQSWLQVLLWWSRP